MPLFAVEDTVSTYFTQFRFFNVVHPVTCGNEDVGDANLGSGI